MFELIFNPKFIHYLAAALSIVIPCFGVSFGFAAATGGLMSGVVRQIGAYNQLRTTLMYGMILIESVFIFSFIVTLLIIFPSYSKLTFQIAFAELGIALAVGLSVAFSSIASGFAVQGALRAVARQPLFANKIQMQMFIVQSLIETPFFFAFVISLIIRAKLSDTLAPSDGIRLMASGLAIGLGSIGPSIGQLIFAKVSCYASGINKQAFSEILTFCILNGALIEVPVLFSFIIAIFLLFKATTLATSIAMPIFLSIAFLIGIGTAGASIGIGMVGSKAISEVAIKPANYSQIFKVSLGCQILIEIASTFAFLTALIAFLKIAKF